MRKVFVLLFIFSAMFLHSCMQWKVSNLKSKQFAFIENGTAAGKIAVNFDDYALNDFSFGVGVYNGKVITTDNILKRVQIIDPDGEVDLVIGDAKNVDTSKVTAVPFTFSAIGSFTMDRDGRIYVQNRLPGTGGVPRTGQSEEMDFSPSYILVFDKKGKLQHTLGQRGTPDLPFYYVDSLYVDERERLFVISRSFDSWSVYRFSGKKRDFFMNLETINFSEKEGDDIFEGKIENAKVYQNGETILISVAYYHNKRLKYHKVYDYSIKNAKIGREIINIPDPKNVLFNIVDDKHLYFWNIEGSNYRFMICNMEGHIINNIQLNFNDVTYLYSKIIGDESGRIYSYHLSKKGITVLEWE